MSQQDLPLVTAVVATRNRPEMLRTAIDAILAQSYAGPIECVVVFDQAEPDAALARDDPHRRVVVIGNNRAPGLAGARNSGILEAHGKFVAFCDDDDVWRPAKLERQLAELGEAIISVTGIVIDYGGHRLERVPDRSTFTLGRLVRDRLMEAHPSTVVVRRRDLLESIGLVDEEIPGSYGEDFDFMIRAMQAGELSVVEEPLCLVRWGQSMFSRDWNMIVAAIDYLIDKHEIFHRDRQALARLYGRRGFACAAMGRRKEALRDAWRTIRLYPLQKRAYVTVLASTGLIPATRILDMAHRRGRGI